MQSRLLGVIALTMAVAVAGNVHADAPASVAKTFDKVIAAVTAGDREAFIALGTPEVKSAFTPELMKSVRSSLGKRLEEGYTTQYLCELNQAGLKVHLWKVTFADGGDDAIVRMAMQKDLVAGFFLQ